jgi:hypothetical protein
MGTRPGRGALTHLVPRSRANADARAGHVRCSGVGEGANWTSLVTPSGCNFWSRSRLASVHRTEPFGNGFCGGPPRIRRRHRNTKGFCQFFELLYGIEVKAITSFRSSGCGKSLDRPWSNRAAVSRSAPCATRRTARAKRAFISLSLENFIGARFRRCRINLALSRWLCHAYSRGLSTQRVKVAEKLVPHNTFQVAFFLVHAARHDLQGIIGKRALQPLGFIPRGAHPDISFFIGRQDQRASPWSRRWR